MAAEIVTLFLMAFALGMDAFSVSLGMGLVRLRWKQIFDIGIYIGIFHMIMPLIGIVLGKVLSEKFGLVAMYIGGCLLTLLGVQMIYSSFKRDESPFIAPAGIGLFLFALSVSLDSFSVGLSLGIYGAEVLLTVIMFGFMSMVLTWSGLLIGKRVQDWFGTYSEAFGGSILLVFGLKLLFSM
jgi:manganese efflux pump family protein